MSLPTNTHKNNMSNLADLIKLNLRTKPLNIWESHECHEVYRKRSFKSWQYNVRLSQVCLIKIKRTNPLQSSAD